MREIDDQSNIYLYQPTRYKPPTEDYKLSELPNTFWLSNIDAMNQIEQTHHPAKVDFMYATTVGRSPHYMSNTIQPFIREGVASRDQRRKVYRFNQLRDGSMGDDMLTIMKDAAFVEDNFAPSTDNL